MSLSKRCMSKSKKLRAVRAVASRGGRAEEREGSEGEAASKQKVHESKQESVVQLCAEVEKLKRDCR